MNGTRKEPTARAKERAALPAGKAQRERGTFVRIIGEVDRPFLLIVIALLCIGSVMVFSASYAYGKFYFNDSYYFARRQLGWAVLGLAGMCFTAVSLTTAGSSASRGSATASRCCSMPPSS